RDWSSDVCSSDLQHAEVLILQPDAATGPRHAGHLAHDRGGIGHVQDDGDGERDVEAARRERRPPALGVAERDARARCGGPAEASGGAEHGATAIDADDLAATAHERRQVAHDDAAATADFEDAVPTPH